MEKRKDGGEKERVISSSCCCDVWGMLGSGPRHCPPALLKPGCKPANYSRAKGWRCDPNSYFRSGADWWEPLRRESGGSRSRTKEEVPASNVTQQRGYRAKVTGTTRRNTHTRRKDPLRHYCTGKISASSGISVPSINAELISKLTEQLVNR